MTTILIVGCGGIGSALFQDLARTRFLQNEKTSVILIDGDTVERKNIGRQHFTLSQVGKYKAEALAETATKALNLKNIWYVNKYLESVDDLRDILVKTYGRLIIVGCVDNHSARLILEEYVKQSTHYREKYYIDCANEMHSGEVVAVIKEISEMDNIVYGSFRSEYDPNLFKDKTDNKQEKHKQALSCSDQVSIGEEQTIIANRKAAIIALELITDFINGEKNVGICYFKESVIKRVVRIEDDT